MLNYCRSRGIPTVFWNKEDPPHFDDFIGAAKEFDFVFTTDADCVPMYREALGTTGYTYFHSPRSPDCTIRHGGRLAQTSRMLRRELDSRQVS